MIMTDEIAISIALHERFGENGIRVKVVRRHKDKAGNVMTLYLSKFGVWLGVNPGEVIPNECLFNPSGAAIYD